MSCGQHLVWTQYHCEHLNLAYLLSSRATTHSDLVLRAVSGGIKYRVIHNASILNAVGCCGLQVTLTNTIVITEINNRSFGSQENALLGPL